MTLVEWGNGTTVQTDGIGLDSVASKDTVTFYERLLAISWELYYTSSVQKASDTINTAFSTLNEESTHAVGVKKDQYDAMRCRFYQLYSLVSRDRMEIDQAIDYQNQAVAIALRLKNAELMYPLNNSGELGMRHQWLLPHVY